MERNSISVFICVFLCMVLLSLSSPAQTQVDSFAVPFTLKDIKGIPFGLKDHLGKKLTVVLFWATWGHDSSEMLDDIEQLYQKYGDGGLEAIGVCVEQQHISDTANQKIIDTVTRKQLTFPILLDDQLKTFRQYNIIAVPTTIVINSGLKILFHLSGYPIVGREQLFDFIKEQFEGKQVLMVHKKFDREHNKKAMRMFNMAQLKFVKNELDTAKKYAFEAASLDSLFVEPLILLSEIAIEEKDLKNAITLINRALHQDPKSIEALSLAALIDAKNGEASKAAVDLEALLHQVDTIALIHCYLGYALGLTGNIDRSMGEFTKAEKLNPDEYRIPTLRAEILERVGKQKEAEAERHKAKQLRKTR